MQIKEVLQIIESSFQPLHSKAESSDYEHEISFRVFGPDDKAIYTSPTYRADHLLKNKHQLVHALDSARNTIIGKGFSLSDLSAEWTAK